MANIGVRAIVSSDWHADAVTAGEERFDEIEETADSIATYAIRSDRPESRSLFVFAGDLTDPDPPRCWRAARLAVQIAHRLSRANIPSIWITGNHDVLEDGHGSHSLMPIDAGPGGSTARVVSKPTMVQLFDAREGRDDCQVLCLPYVPRSHNYDPIAFVEGRILKPHLVVGHLMVEGIEPGSETKDFARGRDIFLPLEVITKRWPGVPIVNGHYHAGRIFRGIHIPGSIARLTVGEVHNSPRYLEIQL
jgi:hypothetical protein